MTNEITVSNEERGAEIRIRDEGEAFELIQQYLAGNLPDGARLELDGWPTFKIRLTGEQFQQTITPSVMHSFIELQKGLYRAYATAKYNDPTKRLTDAEKKALEIRVKVTDGSSQYEIDFQELLLELIRQVGGRMDADHALIAAVVTVLLFVGKSAFGAYLQSRKETREAELKSESDRDLIRTLSFMGEQETRRMELLQKVISADHRLDNVSRIAHDAHTELVKGFSRAERAEVDGFALSGEAAGIMVQNARQKSEEVRLDGDYRIVRVDSSSPMVFKVKVRNIESGEEIEATVQDESLNLSHKKALQQAEWDRRPVRLKINAKNLRGSIRDAIIIEVEALPEDDGGEQR